MPRTKKNGIWPISNDRAWSTRKIGAEPKPARVV
jgi:hypothetical protein